MLPSRPSDAEIAHVAPYHVRSIVLDIVLTFLTCGLWNLLVQAKQIAAVNALLGERKYNFFSWLLLSLITCFLYHIYHEYRMSKDLAALAGNPYSNMPVLHILLCCVGLSLIVDIIQQSEINECFGHHHL